MKTILMAAVVAVGLAAAGAANASEDKAKAGGCLNCHAVDTKKLGPAFKEVAAKYKGKADAEAKLVKALDSGQGHPKSKGSPDDNKALVKWVLGM